MNFDMETKNKEYKAVVINQPGFGKAGNQAIQIMIAQGYLSKDNTNLDDIMINYKKITKTIYKTDLECIKELKKELQ